MKKQSGDFSFTINNVYTAGKVLVSNISIYSSDGFSVADSEDITFETYPELMKDSKMYQTNYKPEEKADYTFIIVPITTPGKFTSILMASPIPLSSEESKVFAKVGQTTTEGKIFTDNLNDTYISIDGAFLNIKAL